MKLDRTRIAIRERGLLETLDLALHVFREFAGPLIVCALLAIVPLAMINYGLVGWMLPLSDPDEEFSGWRFVWNMMLLVYLEAQLASVFVVAYLGPSVFMEERSINATIRDVFRYAPQLFLSQFLLRGVLPGWLLYLTVDRLQFNGFVEGFLMVVLVLFATGMRAFRPYINEIVLLERNPLFGKENTITIGRRSSHLHGPYAGDLMVRWIGCAGIGLLLLTLAVATAVLLQGILISDWPIRMTVGPPPEVLMNITWFKLQIVYPTCLWLVVMFFSVVRFLSYIDLRIRHEGWEVELLMRAEALRLAARME